MSLRRCVACILWNGGTWLEEVVVLPGENLGQLHLELKSEYKESKSAGPNQNQKFKKFTEECADLRWTVEVIQDGRARHVKLRAVHLIGGGGK